MKSVMTRNVVNLRKNIQSVAFRPQESWNQIARKASATCVHGNDSNKLLQDSNSIVRGSGKTQVRCSARQATQNKLIYKRADTDALRNLHQLVAMQPKLEPIYSEFRQIDCEVAESADKTEIVKFVCQHFLHREPLLSALQVTAEEARSFVEFHVDDALKDRASFIARDEVGRICGIRLNAVGPAEEMGKDVKLSPRLHTLIKFLEHVEGDVPQRLQTSRIMRHICICVNPEIARSGVGTLMMQKSIEYSKKHQLRHMVALCSGKFATGLALKMGFRVVKQVPYESYVDQTQSFGYLNDGTPLLPPHKPFEPLVQDHVSAKMMVRDV